MSEVLPHIEAEVKDTHEVLLKQVEFDPTDTWATGPDGIKKFGYCQVCGDKTKMKGSKHEWECEHCNQYYLNDENVSETSDMTLLHWATITFNHRKHHRGVTFFGPKTRERVLRLSGGKMLAEEAGPDKVIVELGKQLSIVPKRPKNPACRFTDETCRMVDCITHNLRKPKVKREPAVVELCLECKKHVVCINLECDTHSRKMRVDSKELPDLLELVVEDLWSSAASRRDSIRVEDWRDQFIELIVPLMKLGPLRLLSEETIFKMAEARWDLCLPDRYNGNNHFNMEYPHEIVCRGGPPYTRWLAADGKSLKSL